MPLYEFFCYDCRTTFSLKRSFSQAGDAGVCPEGLNHHTRKVIAAVAVISNGTRSTGNSLSTSGKASQSLGSGCGCGACSCGAG